MRVRTFLIIGLMMLLCACRSLFSTRDPETPVESQSSWIPPLSPELVLMNMQNAILERNSENFIRCLSSSERLYVFIPDPDVMANYGEIFNNWNLISEQTAIQQVFSLLPADSTAYLLFPEDIREVQGADSTVFVKKYLLEIHPLQTELPTIYEGQVEYWLYPNAQGEWSIYNWTDFAVEGAQSWSYLKALLSE